ncbi:MAG: lysozyme inhibitor LprI family protein [Pseudomonadota bacterium]
MHEYYRAILGVIGTTLTIAIIGASAPAGAQDKANCNDPQSQSAMNRCAAEAFDAADRKLNSVYKRVRAHARDLDDEHRDLDPKYVGAEKALVEGQRGWIAYRDGHCTLHGFEARGGSMEPMLVSGCMANLTRIRTKELREVLKAYRK